MLISKEDFTSDLVEFSIHTADEKVNPAIAKAVRFDLADALPHELYKDILKLEGKKASEWEESTSYKIGEYALSDGVVYKAVAENTNSLPEEGNINWEIDELMTFFYGYVKPFLVLSAYCRILGVANAQYTASGLRELKEVDSQTASKESFADFINSHKKDQSRLLKEMTSELNRREYKIAGLSYKKNVQELKQKSAGYSGRLRAV